MEGDEASGELANHGADLHGRQVGDIVARNISMRGEEVRCAIVSVAHFHARTEDWRDLSPL